MSELFPTEQVCVESPRLRWMKKHGVKTLDTKQEPGECPETGHSYKQWAAWTGDLQEALGDSAVGDGDTEADAIADWAKKHNVRLWNEEP